ncbi:MAG TPA: cation:proton antiporter [Anaerolineae bacterium]|nr:cation:proton antiporter [Anaerolineae bacterium]
MSETLQLLLALALIIFAAKAGGYLATHLHQPAVVGELLAGLVLGPSVINLFHLAPFAGGHTQDIIYELAEVGVIFLMFVAGLEVNLDDMIKSGKVALLAGNLGVLVPIVLGTLLALAFGKGLLPAIFVGLILTATSVSISAQTLMELGVLRSKEGLALLGAAVVDDVVAILALSIFLAVSGETDASRPIWLIIVLMVIFFAVSSVIGARFLTPLAQRVQKLPISSGLVAFVIVVILLYAWAAEMVGGVAAITGAFIAGVFFARTSFAHQIEEGMHNLTYAFFVPIFLVSIGLRANLWDINASGLIYLVALILVAILSKIIGSAGGARLGGFDNVASLRVGLGMVSRGEVGLIITTIGLGAGLVASEDYSQVVIMVLVTTLVTPLLLRWGFSAQQRPAKTADLPDAASTPSS